MIFSKSEEKKGSTKVKFECGMSKEIKKKKIAQAS